MEHLMSILTTMKGIPLAYNKDMQEDKELAFDAIDTTKGCIALFTGMICYHEIPQRCDGRAVQRTALPMRQMQQIIW